MPDDRKKFFLKKNKTKTEEPINSSSLIQKLTDYLDSEGVEFEDIKIEKMKISEIKTDFKILSKYFILIFDEFRRCFNDINNSDVSKLISKYKIISLSLVSLSQYENSGIEFGKNESMENLIRYVKDNYYDIVDFINICLGISE